VRQCGGVGPSGASGASAARRAGCLPAPHPVFGVQHGRVHEDVVRHRAHEWDELHEDPRDLVLIGIAPDGVAMVGGIKNAPRHRQKDERPAVVQQDYWGKNPRAGVTRTERRSAARIHKTTRTSRRMTRSYTAVKTGPGGPKTRAAGEPAL
jgi:hypothetical protein